MAFPSIPTVAGTRILTGVQANNTATRTFPSLSGLTKSAGDLLIAICLGYEGAAVDATFSGWTGGFTEFMDESTGSAGTVAAGAAYKFSTGSETGTFAVTQAAAVVGHACFILLSISGAHASAPPEYGGTGWSGAGTPPLVASFGPSWGAADTLWIAIAATGETSTAGSFTGITAGPSDSTDYAQTGISGDAAGGIEGAVAFAQENAATNSFEAFTVDTSNSQHFGVGIAVRPFVPFVAPRPIVPTVAVHRSYNW